jgi:hypothetical protein
MITLGNGFGAFGDELHLVAVPGCSTGRVGLPRWRARSGNSGKNSLGGFGMNY